MMALIFPDRQRENLKLKFKREEKTNPAKVHRALNRPLGNFPTFWYIAKKLTLCARFRRSSSVAAAHFGKSEA